MEKEFFKLVNNSIYGKTCENQAKHTDIRLLTDIVEFQKLSNKPQCQGVWIFSYQFLVHNLKKVTVTINNPFYVGFAVLELSKLHMIKYAAKSLFSDTILISALLVRDLRFTHIASHLYH